MDNNAAGLPPLAPLPAPAPQPLYTPPPGVAVPPPRSLGVPGRPSNDPDAQQARAEKSRDMQRLASLTPTRAKDHKLHVFRTDGAGRVRGTKPVLVLLSTEIERQIGAGNPDDPDAANRLDDMITENLPENAPDGVYKCQWYDKTGRAITDPPAWELVVGDAAETAAPVDDDGLDDGLDDAPPPFTMPVQHSFQPPAPTPPPAPALDLATVGSALREERREEGKRSNETMSLIVSMQQQSQQQMAMMMQLQQSQQAAAAQLAAQAEERDRQRRSEFRQTLMAMLPMVLPMIQQWFAPKEKGASAEMGMLLELVKANMTNKGTDAVMFENMMKLNSEMTKQAMELQRSGASESSKMQAEATSVVFKNLMNTLQETMAMKTAPQKEEESTLSQIAKIAGPLIAAAQQQQNQPAAPQPDVPAAPAPAEAVAQPRPAQRPAPKLPPPAEQPVEQDVAPRAPRKAQRPAATKPSENPADYSDSRRITACMHAVRRMSIGELPPDRRWGVIEYLSRWLPSSLVDAIKARDKDKVMLLASDAVLANATLLGWITDEDNRQFLQDVLEDVRVFVTNAATETYAAESMAKAQAFLAKRQTQIATQRSQQDAAITAHHNPEQAPPVQPPVAASLASDAPVEKPPVAADVVVPPAPAKKKMPPPTQG